MKKENLPNDSDNKKQSSGDINFKRQVEKGLHQLDNGEGIAHDDVKKRLQKWLK